MVKSYSCISIKITKNEIMHDYHNCIRSLLFKISLTSIYFSNENLRNCRALFTTSENNRSEIDKILLFQASVNVLKQR